MVNRAYFVFFLSGINALSIKSTSLKCIIPTNACMHTLTVSEITQHSLYSALHSDYAIFVVLSECLVGNSGLKVSHNASRKPRVTNQARFPILDVLLLWHAWFKWLQQGFITSWSFESCVFEQELILKLHGMESHQDQEWETLLHTTGQRIICVVSTSVHLPWKCSGVEVRDSRNGK